MSPWRKEIVVLKKLLRLTIVCHVLAFGCFAFAASASAAVTGPLDGETLSGNASQPYRAADFCGDNGDGTSYVKVDTEGLAAGPVPGTYYSQGRVTTGGVRGVFTTATGSLTDFNALLFITPASAPDTDIRVVVTLGSGHGVASCSADSASLNVTDATYTTDSGDTGVVTISTTVTALGVGTFTANFGPQLPTTTEQCKKGGAATYPGFKNQGDCVSYVASKGKNPPGK